MNDEAEHQNTAELRDDAAPFGDALTRFASAGVALFAGSVVLETCDILRHQLSDLAAGARVKPSDAITNLIKRDGAMGTLARRLAGENARPVRILAFDKHPKRNWALGWHQDRVIAVQHRCEMAGFRNWTVKAGVPHVEPPESVLRGMFSLRLHLDDCGPENGPLKVISGSWQRGRLETDDVQQVAASSPSTICTARRGDILAMRALTLHASDTAVNPTHRRVLHVDYATTELPAPLEWVLAASM